MIDFRRSSEISGPNWFHVLKPIGGVKARPLLNGGLTGKDVEAEQAQSVGVGQVKVEEGEGVDELSCRG